MTSKQLWEALPEELWVNEPKFRALMEEGVGQSRTKEERNARSGGDVFRVPD